MDFNGSLSIKASTKSKVFLGANSKRTQAMFYNKSPRTLYLNFDGAASIKSWVVEMREGDYFELPIGADGKVFSGAIFGAWDGEGGYCRVTELVRK